MLLNHRIIGLIIKFNDDGEPSGSAGSPILKIILEENLSNILVVVTRYFGGTLLGVGGLVRAYSEVTKKALEKAKYIKRAKGYKVEIELEYSSFDKFKYYLSKNLINISNVQYLDNIEVIIEVKEEELNKITNINSKTDFKILKYNILEEKYIDI